MFLERDLFKLKIAYRVVAVVLLILFLILTALYQLMIRTFATLVNMNCNHLANTFRMGKKRGTQAFK